MRLFILILNLLPFGILAQDSEEIFRQYLLGVDEISMRKRIAFVKNKTDYYLMKGFKSDIKRKFFFAFPSCSFASSFSEGSGRALYFSSMRSSSDTNVVDVINKYQFEDKDIALKVQSIDIYYDDVEEVKLRYYSTKDSLLVNALHFIYLRHGIDKIRSKVKEAGFKDYYTILLIDELKKTYSIILKDKKLPHKFFIQ